MSDETPDNGAPSAFVFPVSPQDVVLRLAILVEEVQGEGLLLSATLSPGGETWEPQAVEEVFRSARTAPQPGTYIFEANDSGVGFVSGPEEISASEGRDMVFFLAPVMSQRRDQLVKALEAFPTSEVIDEAARRIVSIINIGSLEHSPFDVTPVVDARTVKVKGVCAHCGFGIGHVIDLVISSAFGTEATIDDGVTILGNLKFAIREQDGQPVVQVGYLGCSTGFAAFLNGILADRVHASVQAVALEVMTQILVKTELGRRQFGRVVNSMLATYDLDPGIIASRVDAIEAEARARLAPPPEADGDGTDEVDELDDEDTGDGLDDEASSDELLDEEPAPEPAAPAPAGDPTEEETAPPAAV